jgi:hypothetical protein
MNDDDKLFPLPAGAELAEQAEALARAAWLMASPGESCDPPDTPGLVPELSQGNLPVGSHRPPDAAPFPLCGEGLPPLVVEITRGT